MSQRVKESHFSLYVLAFGSVQALLVYPNTCANKLNQNSEQEKTFTNRRQEGYVKKSEQAKKGVTKVQR